MVKKVCSTSTSVPFAEKSRRLSKSSPTNWPFASVIVRKSGLLGRPLELKPGAGVSAASGAASVSRANAIDSRMGRLLLGPASAVDRTPDGGFRLPRLQVPEADRAGRAVARAGVVVGALVVRELAHGGALAALDEGLGLADGLAQAAADAGGGVDAHADVVARGHRAGEALDQPLAHQVARGG